MAFIFLLPTAMSCLASDLALDFSWKYGTDGWRPDMPFTVGWTFSVTKDICVTQLGVWDPPINKNPNAIGLWSENGTLLASQTVGIDNPLHTTPRGATIRFEAIEPVVLFAGQTYRIGAEYTANRYLDFYVYILNGPLSTPPDIIFGSAAKSSANAGLAFPNILEPNTEGFFGPNFMFTPIPEPTTITFLLLGLGALLLYARRAPRFQHHAVITQV